MVSRFVSWMQVCSYLFTLLLVTICDENGAIVFSVCNIILLFFTELLFLAGLFLISTRAEKTSFELKLSILLIVGSSSGTVIMGYLIFVCDRNDFQGNATLLNDVIPEVIEDIAELGEELQKLQSQTTA